MVGCTVKTRKWGNSIGITLPKAIVEEQNIQCDEEVDIIVLKKAETMKDMAGIMKEEWANKTAQEMKDEFKEELYDDA